MKSFAVLLTFLTVFALCDQSLANYCNYASCRGRTHIDCSNNGKFEAACGSDARVEAMNTDLRNALLDAHNEYRNDIANGAFGFPLAARMSTMVWDKELARLAELNVKQCAMVHDACRNTPNYDWAGQNLATTSWYGRNRTVEDVALDHVNMWFDEYKQMPKKIVEKYKSSKNGIVYSHFTQMIQDKAYTLGCAIVTDTQTPWNRHFTACNYAHTNILDYPVYATSRRAATDCKTGTNPRYPNLCSVAEQINPN